MCWFGLLRQARPLLGFNVRERALLVYLYRDWLCDPLFLHAHLTYFFPVRTFSKSLCLSGAPLCPILESTLSKGSAKRGSYATHQHAFPFTSFYPWPSWS